MAADVGRELPPRVGLTTYREQARFGVWDEAADLLPVTYADAIAAAGGAPMLLPPAQPNELAALAVLDGLHGLVLSGGADVDPVEYDAPRDPHTGPARPDRDRWEVELVRAAMALNLPVLGVCRGMQLLAVALGGSLIQHLPDVVGNDAHCPTVGVHGRHEVSVAAGSRLADILGPSVGVATYHHQAVERLPESATATAWATDETVEAFEIADMTWVLGVQWHPEVHDGAKLFDAFVAACRARRDAPDLGNTEGVGR